VSVRRFQDQMCTFTFLSRFTKGCLRRIGLLYLDSVRYSKKGLFASRCLLVSDA
jgi:hypothetical protein